MAKTKYQWDGITIEELLESPAKLEELICCVVRIAFDEWMNQPLTFKKGMITGDFDYDKGTIVKASDADTD